MELPQVELVHRWQRDMSIKTGNKHAIFSHYISPLDYLIDLLSTCVPVSAASLLALIVRTLGGFIIVL